MDTNGFFQRMDRSNRYFDRKSERGTKTDATHHYEREQAAFARRLLPGGTLLAVGFGDKGSLAYFQERGLPILGVDPSEGRRQLERDEGVNVIAGAFENLGSLNLPSLSGIWCGSALRHVPEDYFGRVMVNVAQLLPSGAPVFFALELGEGAEWRRLDAEDPDAESLVQKYSEEMIDRVLREKELQVVEKWITEPTAERPERWISEIAVKR